jgi:hypothetical protein
MNQSPHKRRSDDHLVVGEYDELQDALAPLKRLRLEEVRVPGLLDRRRGRARLQRTGGLRVHTQDLAPLSCIRALQGKPATPTFSSPRRYPTKGKPALTPQQSLATIPELSAQDGLRVGCLRPPRFGEAEPLRECFPDSIELPASQDVGGHYDELPGAASGSESDRDGDELEEPAAHRSRRGQPQYRLVLPERITTLPAAVLGGPASAPPGRAGGMFGIGDPLPAYHPYALVPYVPAEEALRVLARRAEREDSMEESDAADAMVE